jgi:hypothetical protein
MANRQPPRRLHGRPRQSIRGAKLFLPIEEFNRIRHDDKANVWLDAIVDGQTYVNNLSFGYDPELSDRRCRRFPATTAL